MCKIVSLTSLVWLPVVAASEASKRRLAVMTRVKANSFAFALGFNLLIAINLVVVSPSNPATYSYAQTQEKVRSVPSDVVTEDGCPVAVTAVRTELDLDPFGAPIDARIYIDYKNLAGRPINAVKFRVRFTDDSGNDVGTFQAPDGVMVQPGQIATQKWRESTINPKATALKIRVLKVRYADGSMWQSVKAQDVIPQETGGTNSLGKP